ncbi:hypothetical protein PSYMO_38048, partial [Pseudomonas amygdali pv. mori str. 301020]
YYFNLDTAAFDRASQADRVPLGRARAFDAQHCATG